MEEREGEDPSRRAAHAVQQGDGLEAARPVVRDVRDVVRTEMCERVWVEEEEVEQGSRIRVAEHEVSRHGEEGEVGPPDQLRDRVSLTPLADLVYILGKVTPAHDSEDVDAVGPRQREDERRRPEHEQHDHQAGPGGRDGPVHERAGAEGAPVPGKAVVDRETVEVPVDVVVQDEAGRETEERDQGRGCEETRGKPCVVRRREQGTRAEEKDPCRGEVETEQVEVWPEAGAHAHSVDAES